ncbi:hypothetical protein [Streptomyces hirsutus]|uniref:hypothetical protein n=1 Tax=Streptomyces hirsutus TaxID=35620 RepID=UPI003F4D3064
MTETTIDTTIGVTGQAVDRARLDYVPLQSSAQAPAPTAAQASARWNGGIIPMSLRRVHFLMPGGVDDPSALRAVHRVPSRREGVAWTFPSASFAAVAGGR